MEELVGTGRDELRHTSHTLLADSASRTDWQHDKLGVRLPSRLEPLFSQE